MQAIFLEDKESVSGFVNSISKPRLTKYLQESGGDTLHALQIYHWNSLLSQSLYLPLQSWEIVLRNKLNNFFVWKYGPKWPTEDKAHRNFNGSDKRRLFDTINRLKADLTPATPSTDQIVADLSAGFWVSQFGKNYEAQYSWNNNIKFRIFVHNHNITRQMASDIFDNLLDLRNRVAHHEPIFHLPLDIWRSDLDMVINGMCKSTGGYMASTCSFKDIWNNKPGTQMLLGEPTLIADSEKAENSN